MLPEDSIASRGNRAGGEARSMFLDNIDGPVFDGTSARPDATASQSHGSRAGGLTEIGPHHHIAGRYLAAYPGEASWREDNRRVANGEQTAKVGVSAMRSPVSRQWAGYWQR